MRDLRSFLADEAASIWELPEPVALRHELTALQHELDQRGEFPILLARHLKNLDGQPSPVPVVTNLTASRELTARALGIADHRDTARWFAARTQGGIDPLVVSRAEAPVQQLVLHAEEASLHLSLIHI